MLLNQEVPRDERTNFFIYIFSRVSLNIGDSIYNFAISFFILYETGSSLDFSINIVISTVVALIFLPLSGVIADMGNKRAIILIGEFIDPLILTGLFLYTYQFGFSLGAIYLTTAIMTVTSAFAMNAFQTSITELFHKSRVQKVLGYTSSFINASGMIGPVAGGMLSGLFSFEWIVLGFAFLGFISAVMDFFLKFDLYHDENDYAEQSEEDQGGFKKLRKDLKIGLDFVLNHSVFRPLILYLMVINFVGASLSILPSKMLVDALNFDSTVVGLLYTAFTSGAVIAGVVVGNMKNWKNPLLVSKRASIITGIMVTLLIIPIYMGGSDIWKILIIAILFIAVNMAVDFINIPVSTFYQQTIPQHIKGRIISMITIFSMCIMPMGTVLYGFLYDLNSYIWINLASGVGMVIATFFLFKPKVISESKRMTEAIREETEEEVGN
ncbi:MFS transporter [Barrientosiimonas marina]|uniref:MFS transporter n=1 Tax=Lentibacillus kimchii TaxID=1542911 RepID=A0ABW2UUG3_9BACI